MAPLRASGTHDDRIQKSRGPGVLTGSTCKFPARDVSGSLRSTLRRCTGRSLRCSRWIRGQALVDDVER
jgi:hypothetical protein